MFRAYLYLSLSLTTGTVQKSLFYRPINDVGLMLAKMESFVGTSITMDFVKWLLAWKENKEMNTANFQAWRGPNESLDPSMTPTARPIKLFMMKSDQT